MRKQIIIALCTISSLNCMENQKQCITRKSAFRNLNEIKPRREPREWDAQAYDEGNKIQTEAFLQFLASNKVNTNNKTVLDVGCGTGKIASKLAKEATHIHGFDASKNMIEQAQKNFGHIKNISFEHCFAEDFNAQKTYQLAMASFSIHWFENQQQAFQQIYDSLAGDGDFFATVQTRENPARPELVAAQETMENLLINKAYKWFAGKDLIDVAECTLPATEELKNMLESVGFTILKCEEQSFFLTMTKDDIIKTERPIILSRPIMKYIPDMVIEPFFNDYIDHYLAKLETLDENKYLEPITTTIIHARKIKK